MKIFNKTQIRLVSAKVVLIIGIRTKHPSNAFLCFKHRPQVTKTSHEDEIADIPAEGQPTDIPDKICDVQFAFLLFVFQFNFLCEGEIAI